MHAGSGVRGQPVDVRSFLSPYGSWVANLRFQEEQKTPLPTEIPRFTFLKNPDTNVEFNVFEDVQLKGLTWTWRYRLITDSRRAQADLENDPDELGFTTMCNISACSFPCHQGHRVTAGRFLTDDSLLTYWVDSRYDTASQQHQAALGKGTFLLSFLKVCLEQDLFHTGFALVGWFWCFD